MISYGEGIDWAQVTHIGQTATRRELEEAIARFEDVVIYPPSRIAGYYRSMIKERFPDYCETCGAYWDCEHMASISR